MTSSRRIAYRTPVPYYSRQVNVRRRLHVRNLKTNDKMYDERASDTFTSIKVI